MSPYSKYGRDSKTLCSEGALCDRISLREWEGVAREPACSVQTLSHSDLWWHMGVLQLAVAV